MDKYYYLASQLPFLKFNERVHLGRESFLVEARKWLSDRDFNLLSQVDLNDFYPKPAEPQILREYKKFEHSLRQEISLTRGVKEVLESGEILKPYLLEGSPLDIERKLLKLRWDFIEEKEEGNYFNLEFLVLFFLKLQILERLFIFDKDKGRAAFDKLSEINPDKNQEKAWLNA